MKPLFFPAPPDLRKWFEKHHATDDELWVGYYKRSSGRPSVTWPESVDEALCFGWIDGIRYSIDAVSYKIRFTPRRSRSIWSEVNIRRVRRLIKRGLMQPPGMKAFRLRREDNSAADSNKSRLPQLDEPYNRLLKKNRVAWEYFQSQTPSYRKAISGWVASARKEETRLRRLAKMIAYSERGEMLPEMGRKKSN